VRTTLVEIGIDHLHHAGRPGEVGFNLTSAII